MSTSLYTWRKVKNGVALTLSIAAALFGLMWLVWILWTTITKGMGSLNLDLFTQMTPPPNEPAESMVPEKKARFSGRFARCTRESSSRASSSLQPNALATTPTFCAC